jgi:hypothetical protein
MYNNTRDLRKADFTPLSKAILKTSLCFESRGDAASLAKAKEQLVALQTSPVFVKLSHNEQGEVNAALERLEKAL